MWRDRGSDTGSLWFWSQQTSNLNLGLTESLATWSKQVVGDAQGLIQLEDDFPTLVFDFTFYEGKQR